MSDTYEDYKKSLLIKNQNTSENINSNLIPQKILTEQKHQINKVDVIEKIYSNYYDVSNTITTAGATDPNDFDSSVYNKEQIFVNLERIANKILVKNDGNDTLYVIISHTGGVSYSREVPVYPGETKTYDNVYELRLRSPTVALPYRVMEYKLCCNLDSNAATNIATIFNVTLTNADTEYSQILPTNTKAISFQARTSVAIRFSFETGKVATPTAPYGTIKSGDAYDQSDINLTNNTLYLASSIGGTVVEIVVWN